MTFCDCKNKQTQIDQRKTASRRMMNLFDLNHLSIKYISSFCTKQYTVLNALKFIFRLISFSFFFSTFLLYIVFLNQNLHHLHVKIYSNYFHITNCIISKTTSSDDQNQYRIDENTVLNSEWCQK